MGLGRRRRALLRRRRGDVRRGGLPQLAPRARSAARLRDRGGTQRGRADDRPRQVVQHEGPEDGPGQGGRQGRARHAERAAPLRPRRLRLAHPRHRRPAVRARPGAAEPEGRPHRSQRPDELLPGPGGLPGAALRSRVRGQARHPGLRRADLPRRVRTARAADETGGDHRLDSRHRRRVRPGTARRHRRLGRRQRLHDRGSEFGPEHPDRRDDEPAPRLGPRRDDPGRTARPVGRPDRSRRRHGARALRTDRRGGQGQRRGHPRRR